MPAFNVAGIDLGFRKTGIAIFEMNPHADKLIAATTICPEEPGKSVMARDVHSCREMLRGIHAYLSNYDARALFFEFPMGGSKSSRASRCMGMATGLGTALIEYYDPQLGYLILSPLQVETLLNIHAKSGSKKGKTAGQKHAEKKEAAKN